MISHSCDFEDNVSEHNTKKFSDTNALINPLRIIVALKLLSVYEEF